MSVEVYNRIRSLCASKGHRAEDLEDMTSETYAEYLKREQNGSYSGCLEHLYIDALRNVTKFSRTRRESNDPMRHAERSDGDDKQDKVYTLPSAAPTPEAKITTSDLLESARGQIRIILLLRDVWGLSQREIADLFGLSEARIGQRIQEYQRRRASTESWSYGWDFPMCL